ncbi:uncharacterized protein J4E92_009210 [Alternaria infectoria]|uniref:uncharacterized protein n=1 Tax=Alternaria infectoria TaxID=45303 RepID=UPI0022201385|nr:uncharacterized protein J4E92_009210 [Alternaria infectoria]KAI4916293.1 hypothetical protein J4E92_009210 [Alternaria infectoria]
MIIPSEPAPPTLVDLWLTEKHTFVHGNAWRWTDTGFLILFILLFLFIIGLVCQDADLTVELIELKEGTYAKHIGGTVMAYFDEGIRNDLLQKYIKTGLARSKMRLKREITAELIDAYRKRQRKDGAGGDSHGARPVPRDGEEAGEFAERLREWTEEDLRRERDSRASLWLRRPTGETVGLSKEEARVIAQAAGGST